MSALQVETRTYAEKLPHLMMGHIGKFVVIKGVEVIGIYDSYQDALTFGYQRAGLTPFLVKKIAPSESVAFVSRNFPFPCQA